MEIFRELALVLTLAAGAGLVAKILKQPVLLGYIAAGVAISAFGWAKGVSQGDILALMGQLGVTLLLFLVGLELPINQLKSMGRVALATGLGQIAFTSVAGFFLGQLLGFSPLSSLYIAVALTFSSTIIIVKLLGEKRDLDSLYGKVAVGFLLVQDFVAIGLLIVLSGIGGGGGVDWVSLGIIGLKGTALVVTALWLSSRVLPKVLAWLGESGEMLFVAAIAWCVAAAAVVASPMVGFSLEIGGFLAGLAMSGAAQHLQIGSRIRPLRDFFLTLFFVSLGGTIHLGDVAGMWPAVAAFSLLVFLGNPLIVMVIMGILGYRKQTSFLASITVAQIGEFSLIVMAAAARAGHVGQPEVAVVAMVAALTMVLSTYAILNGHWLYQKLSVWLTVFEKKQPREAKIGDRERLTGHIVLIGYNRVGSVLYPSLAKLAPVVILDFDPHAVDKLQKLNRHVVAGDLADFDIYDDLALDSCKMVVSTVADLQDNLQLLHYLKKAKRKPLVIATALEANHAKELYLAGADFVLLPHAVGGDYLAHIFDHHGMDKNYFRNKGRAAAR